MSEPNQGKPATTRKPASPDALTKGTKKGEIELSEDQLKNVAGGAESADHKHKGET